MVDKIVNNISNLDNRATKSSAKSSVKESIANVSDNVTDNVSDSLKANKKVVANLASSAPVDTDTVAKIKQAISSGNYPLDLDKITDALMEAYNDLKSWKKDISYAFR